MGHANGMGQTTQTATVNGHRITLTNLDKVLYPLTGTTKADVLGYYAAVADTLIAHAANRPATRKRWVHGVGTVEHPGQAFFQKNLDSSTPSWVPRVAIQHKDHANEYPLVNDVATLTWLGQIAALEIHVPQWRVLGDEPQNPDRLVLDLDPGEGATLTDCVEVARLARTLLVDMGLDPVPVTSGSKGIHLYAGLDSSLSSQSVSNVAHELARALEADHPDLVVSEMAKHLRTGKVFVDWSQNSAAKTTVTPYSLRGRFRPTVAAPRTWAELEMPDLAQIDYSDVVALLEQRGDPLAGLREAGATHDRLGEYRHLRDPAKTPEPVPSGPPATSGGSRFVIHRHAARRLHFDLRLERNGVLVSWALPKGIPEDGSKNHLAVHVEDHPLEYGDFEGIIPPGEYGAGEVTIWDQGTYDTEKWREKEVIVTLHGQPGAGLGGAAKIALIHTGGNGRAEQNWLVHRMHDSREPRRAEKPGSVPELSRRSTPAGKTLSPMLATLGTAADLGGDDHWAFEMKWDGVRIMAHVKAGGSVRLLSRNGNDVTATYPEVVDGLRGAVSSEAAILDGEVVALDRKGRPDFSRLQKRMKLSRKADVEAAEQSIPVSYLVFDLLECDAESLLKLPYTHRRDRLRECVRSAGTIQVPPTVDGTLDVAMRTSRDLGLEGVMAKKQSSTYAAGRRSRAWIKLKHHLSQEVVVGGWRPGRGNRVNSVGSLLLGIPDGSQLRYIGRVGTGFSDKQLDEMQTRLSALSRKTTPFADVPAADAADAHWVTPRLVGEVEFAEWTHAGRLRHASWRGWRPDKAADDVVDER